MRPHELLQLVGVGARHLRHLLAPLREDRRTRDIRGALVLVTPKNRPACDCSRAGATMHMRTLYKWKVGTALMLRALPSSLLAVWGEDSEGRMQQPCVRERPGRTAEAAREKAPGVTRVARQVAFHSGPALGRALLPMGPESGVSSRGGGPSPCAWLQKSPKKRPSLHKMGRPPRPNERPREGCRVLRPGPLSSPAEQFRP